MLCDTYMCVHTVHQHMYVCIVGSKVRVTIWLISITGLACTVPL